MKTLNFTTKSVAAKLHLVEEFAQTEAGLQIVQDVIANLKAELKRAQDAVFDLEREISNNEQFSINSQTNFQNWTRTQLSLALKLRIAKIELDEMVNIAKQFSDESN